MSDNNYKKTNKVLAVMCQHFRYLGSTFWNLCGEMFRQSPFDDPKPVFWKLYKFLLLWDSILYISKNNKYIFVETMAKIDLTLTANTLYYSIDNKIF
jgi:hypothetical protein